MCFIQSVSYQRFLCVLHPQILATTAADNIHRVTINAANDMLSESELQTVITSLSGTQQPLLPGNLRPSPHSALLAPDTPPSSESARQEGRSLPMSIEPELVDSGALSNSPTPHGVDIVQEPPSLLVDSGQSYQNLPISISTAQGPTTSLLASTQGGSQNSTNTHRGSQNFSLSASPQGGSQVSSSLLTNTQEGREGALSLLPTTQFQQSEEPTQLSNMLVETANTMGPDQYIIQTTPLMELATSAHTVTINPSATTAVNLTGIAHQGAELQVANSNRLSSELTPISATLEQGSSQDKAYS